jgi:hypothetical protein
MDGRESWQDRTTQRALASIPQRRIPVMPRGSSGPSNAISLSNKKERLKRQNMDSEK